MELALRFLRSNHVCQGTLQLFLLDSLSNKEIHQPLFLD